MRTYEIVLVPYRGSYFSNKWFPIEIEKDEVLVPYRGSYFSNPVLAIP